MNIKEITSHSSQMTFQAAVMLEVFKIHQHTLPFSTVVTTLLGKALKPKQHLFCPYHCFFIILQKSNGGLECHNQLGTFCFKGCLRERRCCRNAEMGGIFKVPEVKVYRSKASAIRFSEPLNSSVPVRTPSQKNRKIRMGRDIKILKDEMKEGWRRNEFRPPLTQLHNNTYLHKLWENY